MKKLIAKLLVGIFSLGLCVNLSAEEWKTYKLKEQGENNSREVWSEDIIKLEKGDSVNFINCISSDRDYAILSIKVKLDEEASLTQRHPNTDDLNRHIILQNFGTLYGPCTVQVGMYYARVGGVRWILCNAKITRASEAQGRNVTGYSLVLPESTDTNYNLVLESSTDLVSWTADTTGTKTPSDKKRFYRLRAVKE